VARDDATISSHVFHGQWSSPSLGLVGDEPLVLFGGSDGVCYAFDAVAPRHGGAGCLHRAWSFDCNPPDHRRHNGKLVDYWEGDKREDRGNHDDWNYLGLNEIIGTPVFYKHRAYVAVGRDPMHGIRTKGGLFCIDATKSGDITNDGKIWSYDGIGRSLSTVSIADGLLYAADTAGRVHCLDADSGRLYWIYDTGSDIWDSTLVADGKAYVGTRRGLCVLEAGKNKNLLADVHLGSAVRSTPTVADDTLFVASQHYLWAVELTKPHVLAGAAADHHAAGHKGG
jgi:outer membrane protein assembly factor BamB